jgi:hypothetical protein
MSHTIPQGEVRPSVAPSETLAEPHPEPFVVPLLRLRGHDRQVIEPEDCLVEGCLVCAWRRAGLLDHPTPRVVRESSSGYTCRSSYCPGCNAVRCVCPPAGYEEELAEQAYQLGHDHGLADGPENRPSRRWLTDAGLDAEPYWLGYDDGCDGLPLHTFRPVATGPTTPVLWDDLDDGMPF